MGDKKWKKTDNGYDLTDAKISKYLKLDDTKESGVSLTSTQEKQLKDFLVEYYECCCKTQYTEFNHSSIFKPSILTLLIENNDGGRLYSQNPDSCEILYEQKPDPRKAFNFFCSLFVFITGFIFSDIRATSIHLNIKSSDVLLLNIGKIGNIGFNCSNLAEYYSSLFTIFCC